MEPKQCEESSPRSYSLKKIAGIAIAVVVFVVIVQAGSGFLVYCSLDDWEKRGTFGDMFGAVNTLFSGLALAGVICAIVMQSIELRYQREDLRLTREELTKSAEAQAETARILKETERQQRLRWQYEQERQTQRLAPVLVRLSDQGSGAEFEVHFVNRGRRAVDVVIEEKDRGIEIRPVDVIAEAGRDGSSGSLKIPFGDEENRSFTLAYTDENGFRERLLVRWSSSERRLRCDVRPPLGE